MKKLIENRKIIIAILVLFILLFNFYIAFQNENVAIAAFDKSAACQLVGCPDTYLRLCAEIHLTISGMGVVYKCYEPIVPAE